MGLPTNAPGTGTDSSTDKTIHAAALAGPVSNAAAQFISGNLLGFDLASLAELEGVTVTFEDGITPGTEVTEVVSIDLSLLGAQIIDLNSIQLDLLKFINLGLVNQYAQASENGASRAFAGAVSDSGMVSLGGSDEYPASASLDLMQLLPESDLLKKARLTLDTITGMAEWNSGSKAKRDYDISGARIEVESPTVGALVTALNAVLTTFGSAVGTLGDAILDGIVSGLLGSLNVLSSIVPGVAILENDLKVSLGIDLENALGPILAQPITVPDGSLSLDLSKGILTVDLKKILGGTLNSLPANTPVLSAQTIGRMEAGLTLLLLKLTDLVNDLLRNLLDSVSVTVSGHVTLLKVLLEAAGLDVNYSGTLGELLGGQKMIEIAGTGLLGIIVGPILSTVTDTLQTVLQAILDPLLNNPVTGVLSAALTGANLAINTLALALSPVFSLISGVISVNINVQTDTGDTFTEIPAQVSLFGNSAIELNLGKVVVGPNSI